MQILTVIALILGAVVLLLAALLRVLRDLLERGPFDAPSIDDGLAWPPRTQAPAADVRSPHEPTTGVNAVNPRLSR